MSFTKGQDFLRQLPTELRLMIFTALLVVWPQPIFRGAIKFGPLNDFEEELPVAWQILATCRKYFDEAVPILYGKNHFVFCTGAGGSPGMFWRFPIYKRYMHLVKHLGVYIRADEPQKESARRVGHFVKALARHATLENLTVLFSSDRWYEAKCPWDIVFGDHPVCNAIIHLIEARTVRHLQIRVHDGAWLFPSFAQYLNQHFNHHGPTAGRSITFSLSGSCPRLHFHMPPAHVEAGMERMMDMQEDLFQLGILPPQDENDKDDEDDDKNGGPYKTGRLVEDNYEETRLAFDSGVLLPGQVRVYHGKVQAPKVWFYHQTTLLDFFKSIEYGDYLKKTFT